MLILLGLAVVFGSVIAGFMLEHGHPLVLMQPSEVLIVAGASVGIAVIANPRRNLKRLLQAAASVRRAHEYSSAYYLELLKVLYALFYVGRRGGPSALEKHVDDPAHSEAFSAYPLVLNDQPTLVFLCDSLRIATSAGINADEMRWLTALDAGVQGSQDRQPVRALATVADSLPGLGIVAAVLGVVVTMQSLGGAASEIGQKVAAALVGTFIGILLCYGVVGPLAGRLETMNRDRAECLEVLRTALVAYIRGASPLVAAEFARRTIPTDLRPSFDTMADELRRNVRLPQVQEAASPAA